VKKIVFLCSGGGGTMRFVKECVHRGILTNCEIAAVIADRDCEAARYAKLNNVENYIIEYSQKSPGQLQGILEQLNPDLIITTIHKIIDADTVDLYSGKMINLHYSLLPAFKGKIGSETVRCAIDMNCKILGTTVHYVEKKVDSGTIISQNAFPNSENTDFKAIMNRMFRLGCVNLINSMVIMGVAHSDGSESFGEYSDSIFSPHVLVDLASIDECIWHNIT